MTSCSSCNSPMCVKGNIVKTVCAPPAEVEEKTKELFKEFGVHLTPSSLEAIKGILLEAPLAVSPPIYDAYTKAKSKAEITPGNLKVEIEKDVEFLSMAMHKSCKSNGEKWDHFKKSWVDLNTDLKTVKEADFSQVGIVVSKYTKIEYFQKKQNRRL